LSRPPRSSALCPAPTLLRGAGTSPTTTNWPPRVLLLFTTCRFFGWSALTVKTTAPLVGCRNSAEAIATRLGKGRFGEAGKAYSETLFGDFSRYLNKSDAYHPGGSNSRRNVTRLGGRNFRDENGATFRNVTPGCGHGNRIWQAFTSPVRHQGVHARLRRAMERSEFARSSRKFRVRGALHRL
jgi:hypothetical protein